MRGEAGGEERRGARERGSEGGGRPTYGVGVQQRGIPFCTK